MAIDIKQYQQTAKATTPSKKENGKSVSLFSSFRLFGGKFSDKSKENFYSDLYVLISSGIDLKTSLKIILDEQTKSDDRQLLEKIYQQVAQKGIQLSSALNATGKISAFEYNSLCIGEETGKYAEVLKELGSYFESKIKQKKQITSALSYPAFVLTISMTSVLLLITMVVPTISQFFDQFDAELPYSTRLLIKMSNFLMDYFVYLFFGLVLGIYLLYSQRKKTWFRKGGAAFVLRTPLLGDLLKKNYLARFCQSMNFMLSSGVDIIPALELSASMTSFYPIEQAIKSVVAALPKGKSIHSSFADFSIFDKRMITMLKVAEEVNQLDTMFAKLARQYSDETEQKSKMLSSLMEPILMIMIGLVVGFLVYAIYTPLMQMNNVIN